MLVPVVRLGQGLVDAVVKVEVVREDDMSADVEEEPFGRDVRAGQAAGLLLRVDDEVRGVFLQTRSERGRVDGPTCELLQALGRAQSAT